MGQRNASVFAVGLLMILFLAACGGESSLQNEADATVKEVELHTKEPPVTEQEITLSAVGDILIHDRVYNDAKTDNGYDFTPMLAQVKPFLEDATITVANQETMIGGEEIGLSSYPSFNSPYEVGDALKDAGVDVVTLANNHTLDRGERAIQSAINYWETIDIMYTGAYKDQLDSEKVRVYDTEEGISVAFLAYTYGTNGIPVPEGKDYLVNLIDKDRIKDDIAAAREKADVVVLSLHFGNEYERYPNDEQKELVQLAADEGVHIVLGHHPHVLQPVEWVEGKDGTETFVVYSLGNFLSGQDKLYRQIGGMLNLTIVKTSDGTNNLITVKDPKFLPTYVTFQNETNYEVLLMSEVTEEELQEAETQYEEIKTHMQQWMPELEIIEDKNSN